MASRASSQPYERTSELSGYPPERSRERWIGGRRAVPPRSEGEDDKNAFVTAEFDIRIVMAMRACLHAMAENRMLFMTLISQYRLRDPGRRAPKPIADDIMVRLGIRRNHNGHGSQP